MTTICAICRQAVSLISLSSEEPIRTLNCTHFFHKKCIGEWLKIKHNCPICRAHVRGLKTMEVKLGATSTAEVLGGAAYFSFGAFLAGLIDS